MTKDELKKEAEESFEKYRVTDIDYVVSPYSDDEGEKKLMFNNEYDAEEEYFRLYSNGYLASAEPRVKRIAELEKENAELKCHIGLTVECEKAQKNGKLCLGYGGDEDEPCEQCKNCIKCECGYYQLGETDKDEQLGKAKQFIRDFLSVAIDYIDKEDKNYSYIEEAEQFLSEVEK